MGIMRKAAAALLLISAPAASAADTADKCLSIADAESVALVALPIVVGGLAERCTANLPADAYLTRSGTALAERYRPAANAAWPMARPAIMKAFGDRMPKEASDQTMRALIEAGISLALIDKAGARECRIANALVETLEPLPAANMARLFAFLLKVGVERDKASKLRICPSSGDQGF